jgi:hypothetical protein
VHFFLAGFWLFFAAVIFLWPYVLPETPPPFEPAMARRFGIFALILFGYNAARWYFGRRRARARRESDPPRIPRPDRREEPPNPDFDFSDKK